MNKKEKEMRVEMFRVVGDLAPLVQVFFLDKDAQEHTGLLLLDSGSNENILCGDMGRYVGDNSKIEGKTGKVYTVSGDYQSIEYVNFSFAFGGSQFHEEFGINAVNLPKLVGDLQIIGILGIDFMQRHQLVIDYSDFTVHTSDITPENLNINDCDFFTPMTIGLKYYNMPLLSMHQNGKEIMVLADTGASNNMLASQTIADNSFECHYLDSTDIITGLAGNIETKEAIVNFNLLTLIGDEIGKLAYHDLFKVTPNYIYTPMDDCCDEEGEPLPPIEAIICSPFMAKEGWILDFGAEIMFKRKRETCFKEAV